MLAREGARVLDHRQVGVDGVQLPPHDQRAQKRDGEHVDIGAAQPALADQPAHDVEHALAAVAHALVQIEAAVLGEADAVRHQDPEQLLLARLDDSCRGSDCASCSSRVRPSVIGPSASGDSRSSLVC